MPHIRGIAPVSPDPKSHFNQMHNNNDGHNWFENQKNRLNFRNLKNYDLVSPMYLPKELKESPRP